MTTIIVIYVIYIYIDNITIMVNIIVLLLFWDISYIIYQS